MPQTSLGLQFITETTVESMKEVIKLKEESQQSGLLNVALYKTQISNVKCKLKHRKHFGI